MLLSEWSSAVALAAFAFSPSGPFAVLIFTGLALHFGSGKPRWQLAGVYCAAAVVALGMFADLTLPSRGNSSKVITSWGPIAVGMSMHATNVRLF